MQCPWQTLVTYVVFTGGAGAERERERAREREQSTLVVVFSLAVWFVVTLSSAEDQWRMGSFVGRS